MQVRDLQVEADATRLLRMRVRDDAPAPPLAAHGAICAPTVGDATPHLQLQPSDHGCCSMHGGSSYFSTTCICAARNVSPKTNRTEIPGGVPH